MGVDFLKSRAKPFFKGLDAARIEIARRTLFTRDPAMPSAAIVARSVGPDTLRPGQEVQVRTDGDSLVLIADLGVSAVVVKPRDADVTVLKTIGGCARGRITQAFPTLNLVEVVIE